MEPIQHICSSLTLISPLPAFVMQHFALSANLERTSGWCTLKWTLKLTPDATCSHISGPPSLSFGLHLTFCLKMRCWVYRGRSGERKGREGASMKDLLLGGLSWCNTSTSRHHGNPASAPTYCGEKESVSVLVCTVLWEKKSPHVSRTNKNTQGCTFYM